MSDPTRRWLFADQISPHFLDSPRQPALLIESKAVFRRRVFHRQTVPTRGPYTAGYWAFLERNAEKLRTNHRMRRPVQGLHRLADLAAYSPAAPSRRGA